MQKNAKHAIAKSKIENLATLLKDGATEALEQVKEFAKAALCKRLDFKWGKKFTKEEFDTKKEQLKAEVVKALNVPASNVQLVYHGAATAAAAAAQEDLQTDPTAAAAAAAAADALASAAAAAPATAEAAVDTLKQAVNTAQNSEAAAQAKAAVAAATAAGDNTISAIVTGDSSVALDAIDTSKIQGAAQAVGDVVGEKVTVDDVGASPTPSPSTASRVSAMMWAAFAIMVLQAALL